MDRRVATAEAVVAVTLLVARFTTLLARRFFLRRYVPLPLLHMFLAVRAVTKIRWRVTSYSSLGSYFSSVGVRRDAVGFVLFRWIWQPSRLFLPGRLLPLLLLRLVRDDQSICAKLPL